MSIPVVILAGGFGSRLKSVVSDVPKPLAPVNGRPFLYYCLSELISNNINNFVFSLFYEAGQIIDYIDELKLSLLAKCNVTYAIENEPLGTGGAIRYSINEASIEGDFLVINGDTFLTSGYKQMIEARSPAICVVKVSDVSRYGTIELTEQKLISKFLEKKPEKFAGLINAGLYRLNKDLFNMNENRPFSVEKDLFPGLANRNILYAVEVIGEFIDIGIPEDYKRFCEIKSRNG